jgi:hypothetical protein
MEQQQPFLKRILNKPPMLFPWVALFHAAAFLYLSIDYAMDASLPSALWIQPVWLLAYLVVWLFACDLRRWSVFAYIGLTAISILLQVLLKKEDSLSVLNTWGDMLYPANIAFCFLLIFSYKNFK